MVFEQKIESLSSGLSSESSPIQSDISHLELVILADKNAAITKLALPKKADPYSYWHQRRALKARYYQVVRGASSSACKIDPTGAAAACRVL